MSWLRRLRRVGRREAPKGEPTQALAMVMLADSTPIDGRVVLDRLTREWSDVPSIAGIDADGAALTARIPGGVIGLVHVPIPIPSGDLVGPTALAWHWPEAAELIEGHRGHVIVLVKTDALDAVDTHLLLTKLAASILATCGGTGVYVGGAMLVRSAADYLEDARGATRERLPILSWIGFNPVKTEGGLSGYTTGLGQFGFPELEIAHCQLPFDQLLGTLADIASYELTTGQVLADGDTFGESEFDRTRVRHCRSEFIPDAIVARLEIP